MTKQYMKLGKLFDVGSSKRVLKSQWKNEGIPFYRGREITRLAIDGYVNNELFISEIDYDEYSSKYGVPSPEDILITAIGTIGNSYIVKKHDRFYFKDASVLWLKKKTNVCSEYINLWIKSPQFTDQLDKGNGATVDTLTINKLQNVFIELPSITEQQRIVSILDKAFADIATAKANAEKNLQNARALFESYLNFLFSNYKKRWIEKPLFEVIDSAVIGLIKNSHEQSNDKNWPYVKMNNITSDNRFDFSNYTCVDATDEEVEKFSLRDGDFLFNTRNSYELVGKSCIYNSSNDDIALFNNNIMRIRFKHNINAKFLLYAFLYKPIAHNLNALKSGTTNVSAIYFNKLKTLIIPIPPLETQKIITSKLENFLIEKQRLETLYQNKLTALEELKKSILHKAFSGEL